MTTNIYIFKFAVTYFDGARAKRIVWSTIS